MAYGITSTSKIIDANTIISACKEMRDLAGYYENIGKKVKEAGGICTAKVLSVDDLSFSNVLVQLGEEIVKLKAIYQEIADELIRETDMVYYYQQQEYQSYLNEQKAAEQKAQEQKAAEQKAAEQKAQEQKTENI